MKNLPFYPLPEAMLKKAMAHFAGLGSTFKKGMPKLGIELRQADIMYSAQEYASVMAFVLVFYSVLFGILFSAFFAFIAIEQILIGPVLGIIVGFLMFAQFAVYPKIQIKKKVRDIERNLIFAIRTMLVQIKAGVGLFQAMNILAQREHGALSKEFEKTIQKISAGVKQEEALQEMAAENPSPALSKVLWQIINGIKGGTEIAEVLQESLSSINREKLISIRKYGADLKLDSLIYMMIGVIIPALGLTFLIVLGSFPKIEITEFTFWGLLGFVSLMDFMFMGVLKNKRPNLLE